MSNKWFISAESLFENSVDLSKQIIDSGFKPNFIVGVWRGGTPVGIVVQEVLQHCGIESDHISVRTSSYNGMKRKEGDPVRVHGLDYLIDAMNSEDRLLIVDDVFDTGISIWSMIERLKQKSRKNYPTDVRIATPYYKPGNNRTDLEPDYFIHSTERWLVFPHELSGLTDEEIRINKPYMYNMLDSVDKLKP